MKCPFCASTETQVLDSRTNEEGDSIRRRRRCLGCQKRFTTYETAELRLPQIIKHNGSREEFDRDKVRVSFQRALHKRPVTAQQVDEAIGSIIQRLLAMGAREVPSREVGGMVMDELRQMDAVAYIRFASVYRSFEDVEDFRDVIRNLKSDERGGGGRG